MHERLLGLDRPLGQASRALVLGRLALRFTGLDDALAHRLDERWRGFLREPPAGAEELVVQVYDAGETSWLASWQPGEQYRIEATGSADRRVVASYYFALAFEAGVWRLGLSTTTAERADRRIDNASRFLLASWALAQGGFTMHGAAVEYCGRAFVLAGPSRAGKSTASRLFRGGTNLGDDFAAVLPAAAGWVAPALPFDNSEVVAGRPDRGELPVAGVWKLVQGAHDEVVTLPRTLALASLLSCAAFPWALPDHADLLLTNARQFIDTCGFAHVHFTREADLGLLLAGRGPG